MTKSLSHAFNDDQNLGAPHIHVPADGKQRTLDVFTSMLDDRIVCLTGSIDEDSAREVIAQLLALEKQDPTKPITLMINSGGGSVPAGLAILGVMKCIRPEVHTVGMGNCASMASILLAAGTPGHRRLYPGTKVMIHQPAHRIEAGKESESHLTARSLKNTRHRTEELLLKFMQVPPTTQARRLISTALELDSAMNATMARDLGLVDEIIGGPAPADFTPEQTPPSDLANRAEVLALLGEIDATEFDSIDMLDDAENERGLRAVKSLIALRASVLANPAMPLSKIPEQSLSPPPRRRPACIKFF